ncbi:LuxR C-terminal-related transcriptional regulator [Microbacterium terricola]|uniref:HTH luxR-type domain-containing protein n=1 Tax=Microbacterium terricola TaxID=344163 RepID=A0ABM8DVK9_9MICO|nr:LuxR C-terminal-related transcriptional regulator [Microbacterium terricola]UYK39630.1 LuxR C-terminal-related transcriptional regulator [Microbacterium terricola]BDV29629.1 hypothetical protein Microterr_02890 [Microbacterium terricola]
MTVTPAIPPHAVDRPPLRALLDIGAEAPLTLVVAPAGSGKTVLLAQWAAHLAPTEFAWLELTSADNDAVHLARRLVSELGELDGAFAALDAPLGTPGAGLGAPMIEALAAAFAEVPSRIVVIFDDLHRVTNRDIITDLWRLVDMLPPNVHFVFSTRVDLRLGWSRHRLRHGLVEIRAAQLAFDDADAVHFLERVSRRAVEPSTAAAAVRRTEGWAAGLQLAGLRLRVHPQAGEDGEALAEGERLAIDYLGEEVLEAEDPARRRALLELSVLEEMSPELVEHLTGVDDGAAFLEELECESLFVVPVHGVERRFRFHHLFRDVLRIRLRAAAPAVEGTLLRAAAAWHRDQGAIGDAIECLLAARLWTEAIDAILARGRDVYERGETATVARWLGTVPSDVLEQHPDAVVLRGMVEGMSGRDSIADALLRSVIGRPDVPIGTQLVARAYCATGVQFHVPAERYRDDGLAMLAAADAAGDVDVPDLLQITSPAQIRTVAVLSIGRANLFLGDLIEAERWLSDGLASAGASYAPYRIHGLGSLAICHALAGRLNAATASVDEALDLARETGLLAHPAPADAFLAKAVVAIQRGLPESGALALHEGALRASANNRTQLLWIAHAASRLIDADGTDIAAIPPAGPPSPLVRDILQAVEQRRRREAGRSAPPAPHPFWSAAAFEDVAWLLVQGDHAAAEAVLDAAPAPVPLSPAHAVETEVLRAWAAAVAGDRVAARSLLAAALEHAAAEHLVQPFLRAGRAVIALVEGLPEDPAGFGREVVARYRALRAPAGDLPDPLTARELELLAFLPSRLTNAELAARCFVSVNTVKTHMAHIYRKLDAAGRDAAIARARELGLLKEADIAHAG